MKRLFSRKAHKAPAPADLRIIGVPRSGTNFLRHVIENNTPLTAAFNAGWWKHAVIPALMAGDAPAPMKPPTVIMFRDLHEQMASFYKFTQQGAAAITTEAGDFVGFLRSPVVLHPHPAQSFWFASPLDYVAQFYFAALHMPGARLFLELGKIQVGPAAIFDALEGAPQFAGLRPKGEIWRPEGYLARNPDRKSSKTAGIAQDLSLASEAAKREAILAAMDSADREEIARSPAFRIIAQMRAQSGRWLHDG